MSDGRAVIGSKNGGMAEMLGNEECGLLVDPNSPKTIIAALEKLIENPELKYPWETFQGKKCYGNTITT